MATEEKVLNIIMSACKRRANLLHNNTLLSLLNNCKAQLTLNKTKKTILIYLFIQNRYINLSKVDKTNDFDISFQKKTLIKTTLYEFIKQVGERELKLLQKKFSNKKRYYKIYISYEKKELF